MTKMVLTLCGCLLLIVGGSMLHGCNRTDKEELLQQAAEEHRSQNYRGAIVLLKNALDKDPNFYDARFLMADAYLQEGRTDIAEKELRKVAIQAPEYPGLSLKMAELFNLTGKPEEAEREAGRHLQVNPGDVRALKLLGAASLLQNDLAEAEVRFRRALEIDQADPEIRLSLADCLIRAKKNTEARHLLQGIIAADGGNVRAHLELARLENGEGDPERALELYRRVIELDPVSIEAHYMSGLILLQKKDADGAEAIARHLMANFPDQPRGTQLLGFAHYLRRQFAEAVVSLQRTAELQPDLLTFYMLGMSYYHLDQLELAANQFHRYLDYRPEAVRPRLALAAVLLKQGRNDEAVSELKRVLQADDRLAAAHNLLGSAYLGAGELDLAAAAFDRAIALDPGLVGARLNKGLFELSRGDLDGGENSLVEALSISPETPDIRMLLAGHYLREQKFKEAIAILEEGLAGGPADALLYNYLAAAHFGDKDPQAAVDCLEKAKTLNPDYLTPYFNLAAFHALRGEPARAEAEYQAVLQRKPDDLKARLFLGQSKELRGEAAEAEKHYRRAAATGAAEGVLGLAGYLHRNGRTTEGLQVVEEAGRAHPEEPRYPELKGKIFLSGGNYREAAEAFTHLERLSPGKGLPLLIETYLAQGETEKAEAVSRQIMTRFPRQPFGYLALSHVLEKQGRLEEAAGLLRQAGGEAGGHPQTRMRLAELEEKRGRMPEAMAVYHDLVRNYPDFAPAHFGIGAIHDRQGRKEEAAAAYRQALQQQEDFAPALNNLAYLYAGQAERREEALQLALRAYRLQPGNPWILDTLGYVFWSNDRLEEARQALEMSAVRLPEIPTIQYHLALVYHQMGESERSAGALRKALDLGAFPETAEARALLKQLSAKTSGDL